MSKFLKEPSYSKSALEKQWINFCFGAHDLICGCNKVIQHFNHLANNNPWRHFEDHTTGETGDGHEEEETGFTKGDLEALFNEENDDAEG